MRFVIFAGMFAAASACMAEESSKWWAVATVRSYHLDRSDTHNEANYGLGVEYHVDKDRSVSAGQYINSNSRPSSYLMGTDAPIHVGRAKFGLSLGVVTGYRQSAIPLVAPTASYEGREWGGNLLAIPPFDGGKWVLGFQIKRRF